MNKHFLSFAGLLFFSNLFLTVAAETRLPAIIGNHMVLQQNSDVKLWGWCDPTEKIKVTSGWNNDIDSTVGTADGKWMLTMKTPSAGGPYTLTINGHTKIVLEDVLIGENWVCSGQSNMDMSDRWGIKQYTNDIENGSNKSIRLFHIPRLTAQYPQDDIKGEWVVCNPEYLKTFILSGFFFGQKLQQILTVPVGLIEAAWGGTPAEVWTPKNTIEETPTLKQAAENLKEIPWGPIRPARIYDAMVHPITNFAIAGVIWYQGEANVGAAATYQELFSSMITSWRAAWKQDFPFYFVQIAPYAGYGKSISGALLQEAQTKSTALHKTGIVVINDLVNDINNIHPNDKKDVGNRLASYALAEVYVQNITGYKSPMYKSMDIKKDKIKINFENAGGGLIIKNGDPTEFYIAGEDKEFMPANAKVHDNSVVV